MPHGHDRYPSSPTACFVGLSSPAASSACAVVWSGAASVSDASVRPCGKRGHRTNGRYSHDDDGGCGGTSGSGARPCDEWWPSALLWCPGYPAAKLAVQHGGPVHVAALALPGGDRLRRDAAARAGRPGMAGVGTALSSACCRWHSSFAAPTSGMRLGVPAASRRCSSARCCWRRRCSRSPRWRASASRQWIGARAGRRCSAGAAGRSDVSGTSLLAISCCVGLVALSPGTLYQKRHSSTIDLRTGPSSTPSPLAMLPLAW